MNRISLTGSEGLWFDADRAKKFDGAWQWDGSNRVYISTGSQWDFEDLYRTAGGRWVLRAYSARRGNLDRYEEISAREAAVWLLRNAIDPPDELADHVAEMEV